MRETPAAIRFISFEPLIGAIDTPDLSAIAWAIVGGENGPQARPIEEAWVLRIKQLCRAYPSLDLFFNLSGMMSLAASAFLPIRLRAPDDEAA